MSHNKQDGSNDKPQLPGVHELFPGTCSPHVLRYFIIYVGIDIFNGRTSQQSQGGGAVHPNMRTQALAPGQGLQPGSYPPAPVNTSYSNGHRVPSYAVATPPSLSTTGYPSSQSTTLRPAEWGGSNPNPSTAVNDRKRHACEICGKRFERLAVILSRDFHSLTATQA